MAPPKIEYTEDDLCAVLTAALDSIRPPRATRQLLGSLLNRNSDSVKTRINKAFGNSFRNGAYNEVIDIARTGALLSKESSQSPQELWMKLSAYPSQSHYGLSIINIRPEAFGRIVRIRCLTPIVVLQILTCLGSYLHIDSLLASLLAKGVNLRYQPLSERPPPTGKMWSYSIRHYFIAPPEKGLYPGQKSGLLHERTTNHIFSATTVVAVHFPSPYFWGDGDGDAPTVVPPFWRLLILTQSSRQQFRAPKITNGVEAYFWAINSEFIATRGALGDVIQRISHLAIPGDEILFNNELQESLLFEDETFSKSRTYFWALQSLRIVNDCITNIISNWEANDKESVLSVLREYEDNRGVNSSGRGRSAPETPIKRAHKYLHEIDEQMEKFKLMIQDNNGRQEQIRALRDGLFSATAVVESRTAVLQGRSIHILTVVSMIFLPASFSTSIFGMESILPESTSLRIFALVFVLICGATYAVVFILVAWPKGLQKKHWSAIHAFKTKVSSKTELSFETGFVDFLRGLGDRSLRKKKDGDVEMGQV